MNRNHNRNHIRIWIRNDNENEQKQRQRNEHEQFIKHDFCKKDKEKDDKGYEDCKTKYLAGYLDGLRGLSGGLGSVSPIVPAPAVPVPAVPVPAVPVP